MQNIAYFLKVTVDKMLNEDLRKVSSAETTNISIVQDVEGKGLRILPITIDEENKEYVSVVPIPASAGYLNGFSDPEYIEELPQMKLPILNENKTWRVFQIKGDSMLPITSGSYIIAEFIRNWHDIKDDSTYILLTKDEGIVYKRLGNRIKETGQLMLISDNKTYDPYELNVDQVMEVWQGVGFISFDMPEINAATEPHISSAVEKLQEEVESLKNSLNR
ncbi:MAG: S24 family peptidase [Bacteroidetes bacterium]|nr:S24 family peptidase [Bacteroidota bacterium]